MCHQSGGLIQRAIEESGIPTVGVISMIDKAERVRPPRAVAVKFPRGGSLGPPHQNDLQRAILKDALALVESAQSPAPPVELDYRWQPGRAAG